VHIQFFNLKTRPAAFGEVHVRGSTFLSHGRPTRRPPQATTKKKKRRHSLLERRGRPKDTAEEEEEDEGVEYEMHIAMSPHVLVRVYYTMMMDGEHLRVHRVELEARLYLRSLLALGAEVPPNSI
jgi:hypothetical protein